jgi:hypothetical protein
MNRLWPTTSPATDRSQSPPSPRGDRRHPSIPERVALIEQRLAVTNARDWDTWQALHTPDAERTAPELEQPLEGSLAMRGAIETLSTAFPDYHLELRQAFGQGEWLAIRLHTTGTMPGPLTLSDGTMVPPTAQPIEQGWAAFMRFEGDRIADFDANATAHRCNSESVLRNGGCRARAAFPQPLTNPKPRPCVRLHKAILIAICKDNRVPFNPSSTTTRADCFFLLHRHAVRRSRAGARRSV